MGYQELVAVAPWTFIAQIGNLLLQMVLLKRFLFKPVQTILRKRQELADAELEAAETARLEAESTRREYARQMAGAKEEAAALLQEASQKAKSRSEQLLTEARLEAAAIRERTSREIARERKQVFRSLKNDVAGMVVSAASRVVEKEIGQREHEELIREFIDRMDEAV